MISVESPYKFFFPIGILYAFCGLGLWVLFWLGGISYPGALHAEWMIQGFLLSFAMGFLMTALPKFLNASACSIGELVIGIGCSMVALIKTQVSLPLVGAIPFAFLIFFALRRLRQSQFMPPPSFVFLPLGLLCGLIGYDSRILANEGVMLAFIFAIGSKLIPALLGHSKPILVQLREKKFWRNSDSIYFIEASIFALGALLHFSLKTSPGDLCWAMVSTSLAIRMWKLQQRPLTKGVLSTSLWIASISLNFSLWSLVFLSEYRLHLLHGVYILGMTLMTLLVATRVILAHGNHDLSAEIRSKGLVAVGILCFGAGTTRISAAFFSPSLYFSHLAYASMLLMAALGVWSFTFGFKIFQTKTKA